MAAEVGSAFVSILPSAKGFAGKLSGQLSGDLDKAGRDGGKRLGAGVQSSFAPSVRGIAASMAGVFAAVKVGGFLKGAISEASDLNESMSKVDVVFGKSAKEVKAFAKNAAKGLGQSRAQALAAAGTFGNLLVALKLPQKQSAKMSTSLVKLAGDLASFNNVDPAEALDALRSGLTGETEPLKRFGVNMNDATLKTEALKLGLIKNTKEALTPSAKAQAAYALVMDQTKTAQGDFARTSDGLANKQRILAAQFTDLKGRIGQQLLPVAVKVAGFFSDTLLPALGRFAPKLTRIKDAISGLFRFVATGDLSGSFLRALGLEEDSPAIGRLVAIRKAFADTVSRISNSFKRLRVNFKPMFNNALGQAKAFAGPLIAAVQVGIETGDYGPLGQALGNALAQAINGAAGALGAIAKALGGLLSKIDFIDIGLALGKQAPFLLAGLALGILNVDLFALLKGLASHWQEVLLAILAVAFTPGKILGKVSGLLARIPFAGRLLSWAFDAFARLSKGLLRAIGDALGFLGRGFLDGFRRVFPEIGGSFAKWLGLLPLKLAVAQIKLALAAGEMVGKFAGAIAANAYKVVAKIGELIGRVLRPFANAGSWLIGVGKRLIQGFIDGIGAMFGAVKSKLGDLTGKLTDWKGPAKRDATLLFGAGQLVIDGFTRGLESRYSDVRASLGGLTSSMGVGDLGIGGVNPAHAGNGLVIHGGVVLQRAAAETNADAFVRGMRNMAFVMSG